MSVVITIELPATEFEIGRVIEAVDGVRIELETIVPIGEQAMPLLRVPDPDHDSFVRRLRSHPSVASVVTVDRSDDVGVYAVEWTGVHDSLYEALGDHGVCILSATKDGDRWEFDLRFPSQETLTAFRERIDEAGIDLEVRRISRSSGSMTDPQDGLSAVQRETLELAIEQGYYSIPRETTTAELGERLEVSDQAIVERLQRAMTRLGEEYMATRRGRPGS
jgi:predicted DNA binding protein